jgi:hypothetical protein
MNIKAKIALWCCLMGFVAVAIVVAQNALSDGKRFYDYRQAHLALPNSPPAIGKTGEVEGAIRANGPDAFIYLNGLWCKFSVATPTPTPTPTP